MTAGADRSGPLTELRDEVVRCRRCPRLVEWRERVAAEKRAAFEDQEYWGRPVPGFGDPDAWLLVVGLAPAAHGANRTGRMFTGDRSGDWLFRALHRAGLASQPEVTARDDGLELEGAWITASVRCAPPENRPRPSERKNCRSYLEREVDLLTGVRVVVPLGGYAYRHVLRIFRDRGWDVPSPMPDFGHGLELALRSPGAPGGDGDGGQRSRSDEDVDGASGPTAGGPRGGGSGEGARRSRAENVSDGPGGIGEPVDGRRRLWLVASYHPSQQNTFTGTLTEEMFDTVWERALELGPGAA